MLLSNCYRRYGLTNGQLVDAASDQYGNGCEFRYHKKILKSDRPIDAVAVDDRD